MLVAILASPPLSPAKAELQLYVPLAAQPHLLQDREWFGRSRQNGRPVRWEEVLIETCRLDWIYLAQA